MIRRTNAQVLGLTVTPVDRQISRRNVWTDEQTDGWTEQDRKEVCTDELG